MPSDDNASSGAPSRGREAAAGDRPLRVIFLGHYFPRPGHETLGTWALGQARALNRNGMEVRVVSFTPWVPRVVGALGFMKVWANCPREREIEGLRVHYPRWHWYNSKWGKPGYTRPRWQAAVLWFMAKRFLRRLVREFEPDAVFCHHTFFNGVTAARLKKITGIPFVVTDHSFSEVEDASDYPERNAVFRETAGEAFANICFTSRMRERVLKAAPEARTVLIHNGSEPTPRAFADTPRPAEIESRTVVLLAARWYERKGIVLLVRAFAALADKYPDAVLRLVGSGQARPAVEEAIRDTGLGADRVQDLGTKTHGEVYQEMAWCDVFALPSWNEPFATVFIEAASAGCPMIWCTDGGITDILEDGVHGYGVEPRDLDSLTAALDRLLASKQDRERMSASARERFFSGLTWDANAQQVRDLLTEAVADRRR